MRESTNWFAASVHCCFRTTVLSDCFEPVASGAHVEKIWLGKGDSPSSRIDLTQLHHSFSMWVWQRSHQHAINHTKDGSGRTNSQSECQNCDKSAARPFEETSNTNTNVLN